jgi:surface antigen
MQGRNRHYWSVLLVTPLLAVASNLSFLDKATVAKFKEQDVKMLMETVDKVLASTDPRAAMNWSNPKTGNSGDISTVSRFTSTDGSLCKRLRVLNRAKTMENTAEHTVCQVPDRGWLLNPEARPAPADAAIKE